MIELHNIFYEYPNKKALKNVSFTISKGSITALVGPNGAGKTTLLRCIAALDKPFSGSITIDGIDGLEHPRQVHRKIGYLSDFFGVYDDLTVKQCLLFVAGLNQIAAKDIKQRVEEIADYLDLTDYVDVLAGDLSRGLKQRLGIAQAILHKPEVLLLDEPASGLDPEARMALSALFKKLQKSGMTILVSSHIISELEEYCTEMLLLRDGEIVNHSQTPNVKGDEVKRKRVEMVLLEEAHSYIKDISNLTNISHITANKNTIELTLTGDKKDLNALLTTLINMNVPIYSFLSKEKRLRDIYMDHTKGGK